MGTEAIHFSSGDHDLVGVMYPGWTDNPQEPRPAAILLHGIPGAEKNWDLAYRLSAMGWHTLIPSFRGTWGSSGDYEMPAHPDDALAALDYLIANWPVDSQKVVLIGYSLGSRAAIVAAGRDPRVKAVVSLSGIADYEEIAFSDEFYQTAMPLLRGVTLEKLHKQWTKLGGDENPILVAEKLNIPCLVVHGTADEIVPYYMAPALHEASHATFIPIQGADHTFTHHRAELVEAVTSWLDHWAKGITSNR